VAEIILVLFIVLMFRTFLQRNMPRVGGKTGPRQTVDPPVPLPEGFSALYARRMTLFVASDDAANFSSQRKFMRCGTRQIPALMRIYCVAGTKIEIEISAEAPDYERIDAGEALALLRELPDPRLIRRLHLSDEPCFLDPWARKTTGQQIRHLGNATNFGLVALYRPDRRLRSEIGLTLLHEWLHIVAFRHEIGLWRFGRANAIEPLAPVPLGSANTGRARWLPHEAWSELGEKLLGYDDNLARQTALASPVHATMLWRRIEKILHKTPPSLRSTRFAEFEARAAFVRNDVRRRRATSAWDARSNKNTSLFQWLKLL
jgi:hypothetical protein